MKCIRIAWRPPRELPKKTMKIQLLSLLFFTLASTGFSQTHYYRDNNGLAAGFGSLSKDWDISNTLWTTSSAGDIATTTWVNNVGTPNDATLDFVGNIVTAPAIALSADLNLRNLEIKGLNNMTGTTGPTLSSSANRTLTFGTGATVTVEDRSSFTHDFYIRQLTTTAVTSTLNVNSFTKGGAGNMLIAAHSTISGANAVVKITGVVNVSAGQVSLATFGNAAGTSRSVDVGDATFALGSGTVLNVVNPLSCTGGQLTSGTAALGFVTGNGTVRGEMAGAANALTITAKGLTLATVGTVGTLIIEDSIGINTTGSPANGTTSFSFANTEVGGLKFDLAANGVNDQITLSELTSVDASSLSFDRFTFNTLTGFANGNNYTLMSLTGGGSWSGFSTLTGTVGGLKGTISLSGNNLVLNVGP